MENQPEQPKIPDIRMIPLTDLFVPDWNPRDFMDEDEMQTLVDFIQAGGHVDRILVWKGTGQATGSPSEPAPPNSGPQLVALAQGPWAIISGQRRTEAFRRLGRTQIEAEILDITLEEAKFKALSDNEGVKPYWLSKYKRWENLMKDHTDWTLYDWKAKFGTSRQMVGRAKLLLRVLNEESRSLIFQHRKNLTKKLEGTAQKHWGQVFILH